jgi:hypothetical protein
MMAFEMLPEPALPVTVESDADADQHAARGVDQLFAVCGHDAVYASAAGENRAVLMIWADAEDQPGDSGQAATRAMRVAKFPPAAARAGMAATEINIGADRIMAAEVPGGVTRAWQFARRPIVRDGVLVAELR